MKAISIKWPWMWAILHAGKRMENRPRKSNFRGTLWLHASQGYDDLGEPAMTSALSDSEGELWDCDDTPTDPRYRGAIVARAEMVECHHAPTDIECDPLAALFPDQDRWICGPHCYQLENVIALPEPVPCKGMLGIWNVPADVLAKCEEQLSMAKKKPQKKKPGAEVVDRATGEAVAVDLTPEQVQYVSATFGEYLALEAPLAEAMAAAGEKKDIFDDAKALVADIERQQKALKERLILIGKGVYEPPVETAPMDLG